MPPVGVLDRDDFKKRHVIHMEYMSRRIVDASKRYGTHVSQLSQIMDLEGLSYFGDSRGMQLFWDALEIDQNACPEYLGNLFLHLYTSIGYPDCPDILILHFGIKIFNINMVIIEGVIRFDKTDVVFNNFKKNYGVNSK